MKNIVNNYMKDSRIVTVAARPGIGKTNFMFNLISLFNKESNGKILIDDLELSYDDTLLKLVSLDEELPYYLVKEVESERNRLNIIFDTDYNNVLIEEDLKDIDDLVDYVKDNNIKYIFIDYVQLLNNDPDLYMKLYNLAKYEEVKIVLLSQLSREVEERENAKPILDDVSEQLKSISDQVVLLSKKDDKIINANIINVRTNESTEIDMSYNYKTGIIKSE